MTYIPGIVAVLVALGLGAVFGANTIELAVFLGCGVLSFFLVGRMPRGSERAYWLSVLAVVLLLIARFAGVEVPRVALMAPFVFSISYFLARLVGRFMGQPAA